MVVFKGWMLNIPRTRDKEPVHVPLNDAAVAALRVAHDRGEGEMACVSVARPGEVFENVRPRFDVVITETGSRIKDSGA